MIARIRHELERRGIDHILLGQSATAFGTRVAGLLLAFLANILFSRAMGANGYGAFAIAVSWASLVAILIRFGFDNSALRFMSVYRDQRKHALLGQFFFGYTVTFTGAFVGLVYGFVTGFILGWSIGFLQNSIMSVYLLVLRTKATLTSSLDSID